MALGAYGGGRKVGSGGAGTKVGGVVWVWLGVERDHGLGLALGRCEGIPSRREGGFFLSLLKEFLANAVLKALPTSWLSSLACEEGGR